MLRFYQGMPLSDIIEKLGKAIFESPFSAARINQDLPELAEIRLLVLDAIKGRSHRVSGRMVFPYNVVRILISGVPASQANAFRGDFLGRYFDEELRTGLSQSNFRFPDDLRVEIQTTSDMPGPKQEWVRVETESIAPPVISFEAAKPAYLLIVKGSANTAEMDLDRVRTHIGRTVDVFKSAGPSRRNDLAFAEDTEINRSVSREHAHIMRDKATGECRLFNDRWYKMGTDAELNCGLWIVREGLSQPVHRNARGFKLEPGDEIHFGHAVAQFLLRQ